MFDGLFPTFGITWRILECGIDECLVSTFGQVVTLLPTQSSKSSTVYLCVGRDAGFVTRMSCFSSSSSFF